MGSILLKWVIDAQEFAVVHVSIVFKCPKIKSDCGDCRDILDVGDVPTTYRLKPPGIVVDLNHN